MSDRTHNMLKNKRLFLFLSSAVALGFFLRLYHLGNKSLWLDELKTVYWINYSTVNMLKEIGRFPLTPLYYLLMKPWVHIFGNSEFALRFPSLIFSTLTIVFIYKLAAELFSYKVGAVAVFLLSISQYSIYYAQEAKTYSMLWFFSMLSFLFFHRFIKDNRMGSLSAYVVSATISIYTMYMGFIFIIIHNILYFCIAGKKRLRNWLAGQLMIILLCLPWMDKFFYNAIHRDGIGWIHKVDDYPAFLLRIFLSVAGIPAGKRSLCLIGLFLYCFLIISAVIYFKDTRHKKPVLDFTRNDFLVFAWMVMPIIIYMLIDILFFPIFVAKYAGFIHIPLIILISKGLNRYNIKLRCVLLSFIVLMLPFQLRPFYKHDYKIIHGENWRDLLNNLDQRADKNSLILTKLLPDVVNYYNRGYQIKPLNYIKNLGGKTPKENVDSIFIVYRKTRGSIPEHIKGYRLEEIYHKHKIGFLWFKKL